MLCGEPIDQVCERCELRTRLPAKIRIAIRPAFELDGNTLIIVRKVSRVISGIGITNQLPNGAVSADNVLAANASTRNLEITDCGGGGAFKRVQNNVIEAVSIASEFKIPRTSRASISCS